MWKIKPILVLSLTIAALSACGDTSYPQGEGLYLTYCANCHMDDGTGLRKLIPPVANSDYLANADTETLVCLIVNGATGGLVVNGIQYNEPMPGFSNLKPADISNIINYLHTSFGNDLAPADPERVVAAYENCRQ